MTGTCDHLEREGLIARELGLPDPHIDTCDTCRSELARFQFLEDLPRMPAWSPSPPGWQAKVWAAIASEDRAAGAVEPRLPWWQRAWAALVARRRWLAVPAVAAAALVALVVVTRPAPSGFALDVEIHAASGAPHRTAAGVVGDRVTARAPRADAVWIYLADGALIARCPGPGAGDACQVTSRGVALTFELTVATRHRIVAVSGGRDLTPSGDFDRDLRAARSRGARLLVETVAVAPGP